MGETSVTDRKGMTTVAPCTSAIDPLIADTSTKNSSSRGQLRKKGAEMHNDHVERVAITWFFFALGLALFVGVASLGPAPTVGEELALMEDQCHHARMLRNRVEETAEKYLMGYLWTNAAERDAWYALDLDVRHCFRTLKQVSKEHKSAMDDYEHQQRLAITSGCITLVLTLAAGSLVEMSIPSFIDVYVNVATFIDQILDTVTMIPAIMLGVGLGEHSSKTYCQYL
mmetsp:Transcript_17139/g.32531  ORF Transcript_17139/g.32531 Transcript_17139/m.32531 type:complete len:227 (+) Transcript_17139:85-765(+)